MLGLGSTDLMVMVLLLREEVQSMLILVTRRNHDRLHMMLIIAHKCLLLIIQKFLLGDLAGLDRQTLRLDVDGAASTSLITDVSLASRCTL